MSNINADENFKLTTLVLPPAPKPLGVYKPCMIIDRHLYISGHGPVKQDGSKIVGKVMLDMDKDGAKQAAQQVALSILATINEHLGSFNKIHRVIKVLGMVNCTDDFKEHPYVINGCSELFKKIWGDEYGVGVRSAVGMNSLPENIPVEIEALFELK